MEELQTRLLLDVLIALTRQRPDVGSSAIERVEFKGVARSDPMSVLTEVSLSGYRVGK